MQGSQLIKELACINRWEYMPFCPICGRDFESPTDLLRLTCGHYVCGKCLRHLQVGEGKKAQCPFDDSVSEAFCDGLEFQQELRFVKGWFQEAENPDPGHREDVVKHLMDSIETLRRGLNMTDVPCRVIINDGTCSGRVGCPYDHTLRFYRKKSCPVPDCPNEKCLFVHGQERPARPKSSADAKTAVPLKAQASPKGNRTKSIQPEQKKKHGCLLL